MIQISYFHVHMKAIFDKSAILKAFVFYLEFPKNGSDSCVNIVNCRGAAIPPAQVCQLAPCHLQQCYSSYH